MTENRPGSRRLEDIERDLQRKSGIVSTSSANARRSYPTFFQGKIAVFIGWWSLICIIANGLIGAVQTGINPDIHLFHFGLGYFSLVYVPLSFLDVVWFLPPLFAPISSFVVWLALVGLQWKANRVQRPVEGALTIFLLLNVPWAIWSFSVANDVAQIASSFVVWGLGFYALSIPQSFS
ncbi:MAG: hypothetical protein ABJN26_14040 [Stappiaceae bacterium]